MNLYLKTFLKEGFIMDLGHKKVTKLDVAVYALAVLAILFSLCRDAFPEEKQPEKTEKPMTLEQILAVEKIENEGYARKLKGPVPFSHQGHQAVACIECHHAGDYTKCSECHLQETEDEVVKIKTAFHRNCKNCHKELKKENEKSAAPYRKCSGCHAKKEK